MTTGEAKPLKLIITNKLFLYSKYQYKAESIIEALEEWSNAESEFECEIVYLDDCKLCEINVKSLDPEINKNAIDDIFKKREPYCAVLVGADDIIPYQQLANTVPDDEDSEWVLSDLPYACEESYDVDIKSFLIPKRLISRLPDIRSGSDPRYLVDIIKMLPMSGGNDPSLYFAIASDEWQLGTQAVLNEVFQNYDYLNLVPPGDWSKGGATRLFHYINCHGRKNEAYWYGSGYLGEEDLIALDDEDVRQYVNVGTVVAAESCYGALLYALSDDAVSIPLCNWYLTKGACAFWGSTGFSYGQTDMWADRICKLFMKNIVQGASVGQAALYARSWYSYYMDKEYPSEARGLKTLAQFVVYGDVSAKPFRTHKKIVPPNNYAKSGNIIKRAESVKYLPIKTPRSIKRELMKRLAEYLDGGRITFQSFEIHTPPDEVFNLPAAIHTAKSIRFKGRNMEVRGVEKVVKHGEDVEPGTDDYSFEGYGYRGDDAKSWRTFSSK